MFGPEKKLSFKVARQHWSYLLRFGRLLNYACMSLVEWVLKKTCERRILEVRNFVSDKIHLYQMVLVGWFKYQSQQLNEKPLTYTEYP